VKRAARFSLLLAFAIGSAASAQTTPPPTPKGEVVIVSLLGAKYPPLARKANITGEVELKLEIGKDGSVASVVVVSGPPMLTDAASDSAKQSRFECRRCESEVTKYSLTYSFQIAATPGWPCPETIGDHVTQSENHIMITGEPALVDLYFVNVRAHSAKCLYLWACGSVWGGEDYYYYRVRSVKCLGLWSCGHRLREPFATCRKLHRKLAY
jgi:TonB family protein